MIHLGIAGATGQLGSELIANIHSFPGFMISGAEKGFYSFRELMKGEEGETV